MTRKQQNDLFWATALIIVVGFLGGLTLAWLMGESMTPYLGYIFAWLARLTTWAQTRGIKIVDMLLCVAPVVLLVGGFLRWVNEPTRGVWIHGQHYEDFWRDD